MKTKRGVWAFQPTGFGSGKVPPEGDPKGQSMAGGASAGQASLRGCGPAAAAPAASGRTGGLGAGPTAPTHRGSRSAGPGGTAEPPGKQRGQPGSAPASGVRMQRNMARRRHVLPTAYVGTEPRPGRTRGTRGTPRSSPCPGRCSLLPATPQSQALPEADFLCF